MLRKKFDFDYIVIGSGTAGSAAALSAARLKKKVALVEAGKWGGSALNSLDVPRKAAFNFSHLYMEAARGSRFGISSASLRYNYPTVLNWTALASRRAGGNSKKVFEENKITCLSGFASFLTPYEISVGKIRVSAPNFLIATGASPSTGNISGVPGIKCLTPADALKLNRPPKSVFVVGGGSTGAELANYFGELGSEVYLGELAGRLLPKEDEEVGSFLAQYFEEKLHIKVLTQSRVVAVSSDSGKTRVTFLRGGQEKYVRVDSVILATGSTPNVDLGLENAGVEYSKDGIDVNNMLMTSMKHISAAGDCIGGESSPERAAYEGALAAGNVFSRQKNLRNYEGFIRLTDTYPGIASVGLTEDDCLKRNIKVRKSVLPLSAVSAANTSDFRSGFVKILADPKDKLLGATVMCPNADLVVEELAVAVRHKFTTVQLASAPHASSSWSELVRLACRKLAK